MLCSLSWPRRAEGEAAQDLEYPGRSARMKCFGPGKSLSVSLGAGSEGLILSPY